MWKHNSRAKPYILPKGFLLFLSNGSHRTGIRSIRLIRGRETSKVKPYVLLLSNSPAETDFPVKPRILDYSSKKNREKFAE